MVRVCTGPAFRQVAFPYHQIGRPSPEDSLSREFRHYPLAILWEEQQNFSIFVRSINSHWMIQPATLTNTISITITPFRRIDTAALDAALTFPRSRQTASPIIHAPIVP